MKVFLIKKRTLLFFVIALLVFILSFSTFGSSVATIYFASVTDDKPIYSVETDDNVVALTFDAAWGSDKTLDILNLCVEYNVKATFFLVGFWVEENIDIAKKIVEYGFEVGLHSNTHPDMTTLSTEQIILEVEQNYEIIKKYLDIEPKYFRVPFGAYNNTVLATIRNMGFEVVQWDVDTHDWMGISAVDISARVSSMAKNGSIILMHNNSDNILAALKLILDTMLFKNMNCVTLSEMIYTEDYEITFLGIQKKI